MSGIIPGASMALVEHLPASVVITDPELRVVHTNLMAGQLLTSQSALQVVDGQLRADDPEQTDHLRARVWEAVAGFDDRHKVVVTALSDRVSLRSLILRIAPFNRTWIGLDRASDDRPVVAIMIDSGQISEAGAQGLVNAFGLSPSEFDIVKQLAQGYAPKEIAQRRGGEVATVRVHIRNLRAKMNCRTDNEAIILFNRFARL